MPEDSDRAEFVVRPIFAGEVAPDDVAVVADEGGACFVGYVVARWRQQVEMSAGDCQLQPVVLGLADYPAVGVDDRVDAGQVAVKEVKLTGAQVQTVQRGKGLA